MLLTETLFMADNHGAVRTDSAQVLSKPFGGELVIAQHSVVVVEAQELANAFQHLPAVLDELFVSDFHVMRAE